MGSKGSPLFFPHIPKTGGTSVIRALRALTPVEKIYTERGNNLSRAYTERLAATSLPGSALLHGHPAPGACLPFRGRARFVTLLRDPREQIVSHYLHALRDPAMPQHAAAHALGFAGFVRTYSFIIPFQTNCLYLSAIDPDAERRRVNADSGYGSELHLERYYARQLGIVFEFLDEMMLVGTLAELEMFMTSLAEQVEWSHLPTLTRENVAPSEQLADASALREQILELEADAALAPLFAIERATYSRARSLLHAARGRRIRARMRAGTQQGGIEKFTVHRSELGEIILGENFEPVEAEAILGEQPTPVPIKWCTGTSQVARFYIKRNQTTGLRLTISADRFRGVRPDEVAFCFGSSWCTPETQTEEDGTVRYSICLDAANAEDLYGEVALHLQWNTYPDQTPFHPRVRFTSFALEIDPDGAKPAG